MVDQKKLLKQLKNNLVEMSDTNFKFFVRTHQAQLVGIMTKKIKKYDTGWDTRRTYAVGLRMDGKKFEEPLDRKNRRTSNLEDLVQEENQMVVMTARKTSDPDDSDDNNFQYLLHPSQGNHIKDMNDKMREQQLHIKELTKKLDEIKRQRDNLSDKADRFGSQLNSYRERLTRLSQTVADERERADEYYSKLKSISIKKQEEEGKLDKEMQDARKRGTMQGSSPQELTKQAVEDQVDLRKSLDKAGLGEKDVATSGELKKLTKDIENRLRNIEQKIQGQPEGGGQPQA